jgi:hypothetical protein
MRDEKFKASSTLFNVPEGSNKKEMFNAYLVQFVNSNDFIMGCGQGYKGFGDVVPSTDKFMGGGSDNVYDVGPGKIGELEQVGDNSPPTMGGYEGGGRATSGPKTAAKAAKARRKKRSSS